MKKPTVKYLKDYTPPDFLIPETELCFRILEGRVQVRARLLFRRNPAAKQPKPDLILDGENLELLSVSINGEKLAESSGYIKDDVSLTVKNPPAGDFTLETIVQINPWTNEALEGLYKSGSILCTQNEPEGFRKITYFIDRPDVMSRFTTTIEGDRTKYPVMLSNGNLSGSSDLPDNVRRVKWTDPFPKPCYLFALVAGDLGVIKDSFKTMSGRTVRLEIYVDPGEEDKALHAMSALKKAMRWDEEKFGLECDLDNYMIVAVGSFNFGAMENKGLNIFNSSCVLARQDTATDSDFLRIEGVVAHEYFHNWTGNRVTCRDWFQLTLKEGLTVFRDQEFSIDTGFGAVKRIDDVRMLRARQFAEDAGPMRHPIRPESYIEINNFYTATVYEKGAEVIRMIRTLIGRENFRKGIDKYFELYDGMAVTADDFVSAMETASGADLSQFRRWYCQSGTPTLRVKDSYDTRKKVYTLETEQSCPPCPGGKKTEPFYFPLSIALYGKDGAEISCPELTKNSGAAIINQESQKLTFTGIKEKPVPSLLRDFSAPLKLDYDYSDDDLALLMRRDSDLFNRYEAAARVYLSAVKKLRDAARDGEKLSVSDSVTGAFGDMVSDSKTDRLFLAQTLSPPSLFEIIELTGVFDPRGLFTAREFLLRSLASKFSAELEKTFRKNISKKYVFSRDEAGRRAVKNICLSYLCLAGAEFLKTSMSQLKSADNMTDEIAALSIIVNADDGSLKAEALKIFYDKWKSNQLVMRKWLAVQAGAKNGDVLSAVKGLEKDPVFNIKVPNLVMALYGSFTANLPFFHAEDGSGYGFIASKMIELDKFNPMMSARLAKAFDKYPVLPEKLQAFARKELERVLAAGSLSRGLSEILEKTLQSGERKP